jgi:seryl-tRNA synthetase
MVGAWRGIWRWRDDRVRVEQLQDEIVAVHAAHGPAIAAAGKPNTREYSIAYNDLIVDLSELEDELETIQTRRRVWLAAKYGVPVPDRPYGDHESDYWERSRLGSLILSEKGHLLLRREIAIEREIAWKPWLSGVALGVSLLSLLVSIVAVIG